MGDERDREFMDESAKELIKISISMKEIVHEGADIWFAHLC